MHWIPVLGLSPESRRKAWRKRSDGQRFGQLDPLSVALLLPDANIHSDGQRFVVFLLTITPPHNLADFLEDEETQGIRRGTGFPFYRLELPTFGC
jgi:hypothetical protein